MIDNVNKEVIYFYLLKCFDILYDVDTLRIGDKYLLTFYAKGVTYRMMVITLHYLNRFTIVNLVCA